MANVKLADLAKQGAEIRIRELQDEIKELQAFVNGGTPKPKAVRVAPVSKRQMLPHGTLKNAVLSVLSATDVELRPTDIAKKLPLFLRRRGVQQGDVAATLRRELSKGSVEARKTGAAGSAAVFYKLRAQ